MGGNKFIVITDGIRYRFFTTNDGEPSQIAYANIEHLRESHLPLFERIKRRQISEHFGYVAQKLVAIQCS